MLMGLLADERHVPHDWCSERSYYAAKTQPPSARDFSDEAAKVEVKRVFDANYHGPADLQAAELSRPPDRPLHGRTADARLGEPGRAATQEALHDHAGEDGAPGAGPGRPAIPSEPAQPAVAGRHHQPMPTGLRGAPPARLPHRATPSADASAAIHTPLAFAFGVTGEGIRQIASYYGYKTMSRVCCGNSLHCAKQAGCGR